MSGLNLSEFSFMGGFKISGTGNTLDVCRGWTVVNFHRIVVEVLLGVHRLVNLFPIIVIFEISSSDGAIIWGQLCLFSRRATVLSHWFRCWRIRKTGGEDLGGMWNARTHFCFFRLSGCGRRKILFSGREILTMAS